mmetsp:Transcript_10354/g.29519  ORF Transcript_10354/g.29519 Transcript_10354/m.29519 type:complete len:548 (-) Transcript_10354:337-1980(-)
MNAPKRNDDGAETANEEQGLATTLKTPPASANDESYSKVIANALKSMSLEERERAYEDIHGITSSTNETPEFLNEKLQQFEAHINERISHKAVYERALRQNEAYVRDPKLRLKFLRCDAFDVRYAAERFVQHFETKLSLFGESLLTTNITQQHLCAEARGVFPKLGSMQTLPVRDTCGRPIVFSFEKYHRKVYVPGKDNVKIQSHLYWWFLMSMTDDDRNCRQGIVYISYGLDFDMSCKTEERQVYWKACMIVNSIPLKFACVHFCLDDRRYRMMMSIISMGLRKSIQSRVRVHFGTQQEVEYSLMSYGIPVDKFPVTYGGELKRTNFYKWMQYQSKREGVSDQQQQQQAVVFAPRRQDVLCARGKNIQNHPGNQLFRETLATHFERYSNAKYSEKPTIMKEIADEMEKSGTQFLVKDESDIWIPASDDQIRDKIKNGFRRKRELDAAARKKQMADEMKKQAKDQARKQREAETTVNHHDAYQSDNSQSSDGGHSLSSKSKKRPRSLNCGMYGETFDPSIFASPPVHPSDDNDDRGCFSLLRRCDGF